MSVDWGRLRGERKRKRPELDAGRAIAAANLASPLTLSTAAGERRGMRKIGDGLFSFAVAGGPKTKTRVAGGPNPEEPVRPN